MGAVPANKAQSTGMMPVANVAEDLGGKKAVKWNTASTEFQVADALSANPVTDATLGVFGIKDKNVSRALNPAGLIFDAFGVQDAKDAQDKATADADKANAEALANLQRNAPDLTSATVQAARKRQAQLSSLGAGRKSTFLTGPSGSLARTTLLGG